MLDLEPVAREVVERFGAAPGAVVAASRSGRAGGGAFGVLRPGGAAVGPETPFDLASVTKPIVALTVARLVRRGRLRWADPLGDVAPDLGASAAARRSLELLAAHRAGLAAHLELFAPLRTGGAITRAAALAAAADGLRPECAADLAVPEGGFPPVYSDLGYLLLGAAVEAREGAALDEIVAREVTRPLGVDHLVGSARQWSAIDPAFEERVAPTEVVDFRGGVVRGVVHDENAWAIGGRATCGHAGLFGRADGVLRVAEAVLGALREDEGWLGPDDLARLVARRPGGSLLAGFDSPSGDTPSSGSRLGPGAFGHLGFTGTSVWIDPGARFCGVLLTNRVHPTRDHVAIRLARPAAYDAMFDALSGGE